MHNADKIPRVAMGVHPQHANGQRVNEFKDGEALVQKARDIASSVAKSSLKRKGLIFSAEDLGITVSKLKVDKGKTRMNSILNMMRSVVKNEPVIRNWIGTESARGKSAEGVVNLSAEQWLALRESEGLLTVMGGVITLAQHESAWTAAYRLPLYQKLIQDLSAESVATICLVDSTKRTNVRIQSDIAKTVLQRGIDEAAKRIGTNLKEFDETRGNKSAATRAANRHLLAVERAAVLLDLRTKNDKIYCKNRDELKPALLELALMYKVNEVMYEMEKSNAASSNNQTGITSESESSDSGSENEVVFFEGAANGYISRARLERTYLPEIENACHKWMTLLKTSKPAFWIEHFPDQIKEDNLCKFTRETSNGTRMDPIKMLNIDMHLMYMRLADDPNYSILPKLAMSILGRNLSESFVERLFSAASLVLNKKSSSMRLSLVQKLTLLRMNCGFMDKVKKKYPNLLLEQVNMESEVGQKRKSEAMELAKSL